MLAGIEGAPPLVLVTGKGGVGKTLVSCALAHFAARAGARVLLLELDARESMHRFLGAEPSGGEVVAVTERLAAQSLRPRRVVDDLIEERVRPAWVARRVLASTIYEQFVQGAPGLREVAALGHARRASRAGTPDSEYDLVVLDAPATGHGVALLEAPNLLAEAVGGGPLAELAREVASMVVDPAQCGLWAVTTAEGMAVRETLELDAALNRRLGRGLDRMLLNRVLPPTRETGDEPPWLASWLRRAEEQARQEAALEAAWRGPLARLPLVAGDGVEALDLLSVALAEALGPAPGAGSEG